MCVRLSDSRIYRRTIAEYQHLYIAESHYFKYTYKLMYDMPAKTDSDYIPRLIDSVLRDEMRLFGGVLITGPKWCGKTTTAEQVAEAKVYLQDKVQYTRYRQIAELNPSLLLRGDPPVLIDEWQRIPDVWGAVRHQADLRREKGLFILTGSKKVDDTDLEHSGAGRIKRLRMRTMSLWESGRSTGDVSLKSLFEGTDSVAGLPDYGYEGMARNLVRGGWPETVGLSDLDACRKVEGYCNEIVVSGFSAEWESPRALKGRKTLLAMMRSLSGATASERSAEAIRNDVIGNTGAAIGINTVHRYLDALRSIYVTDDLPAWTPDLRSKAIVRTTDARHMTDPAIAAYFLDAGPDDLISDPETFGLLFESMVVRDLRVYAQTLGGHVCHYRDKNGLEVDAVVHLPGGAWGAVEVKLNDVRADQAAQSLMCLREKTVKPPRFLAVVTADGAAYTREDGVHVIPLSCLRE